MTDQAMTTSWDEIDEQNLLIAVQHHGFGKWKEVAARIHGKSPSETERHFKEKYPLSPTHPVLLPSSSILEDIDVEIADTEGAVLTSRWGVSIHYKRYPLDSHMLEVNVPDSLATEDIKNYEHEKKYVGDCVTVTGLHWCIATKIDNDIFAVRIPVWELPPDISVWAS